MLFAVYPLTPTQRVCCYARSAHLPMATMLAAGNLGQVLLAQGKLAEAEPLLVEAVAWFRNCLLYTSPSPRDQRGSRMPSSA